MSLHKTSPKGESKKEVSVLPAIAKKLAVRNEKGDSHQIINRYEKFIKDEQQNLKRDLEKMRVYELDGKKLIKKQTKIAQNKIPSSQGIRKAHSTPRLAEGMGQKKKSYRETKERYIHNQRLSMHFNLPREVNLSMDSSNDEIQKELFRQQQKHIVNPTLYVLKKNSQYNKIASKSKEQSAYLTQGLGQSRIQIKDNSSVYPALPQLPLKQQIYTIPKDEKYIKQKFVGEDAVSKFYDRYKNIEKVRDFQKYNLQTNPITIILTILQHYNIPPKRMEVIKLKGEEAILDLKNCALGSGISIKAMSQIIDKVKVFEEVDLSLNNIQSDLCDLVIPNLSRMKRINLSYNKIGRRGVQIITKMLWNEEVQEDCELQQLNIQSNWINDTAVVGLFTSLVNMNSLLVLNLSKNFLGNYCGGRLKEFLTNDNTLTELYLHWAELGPKATKLIFDGLTRNNNLRVLDLSWNQIGLDGVRSFSNFLKSNTTLVHLDISFCQIDQIDTRRIVKSLKLNHTIYGLHYQGNLGFIDFKGYLHPIKKQDRYIPMSIRAGLIQRISGVNIIRDSHAHASYQSVFYKSICWICEGWEEKYFKISKESGEKACFIHFQFEGFGGVMMNDQGNYFDILRMCPPKPIIFFHTKVSEKNVFTHKALSVQSTDIKIIPYHNVIHEFIIDHKKFHNLQLQTINTTPQPRYYSQLFNEDYLTKAHCMPRSDDLKANAALFVQMPTIQQGTRQVEKAVKKKKTKKPKKKEVELAKEIDVKEIPEDFDSLFSKKLGDGEQYANFIKKCVDFDISHSKVAKVAKGPKQLEDIRNILENNYELFQKIYYYLANSNPNVSGVYSISQNRFEKFIQEQSYETKRVTKAKIRLKLISCLASQPNSEGEIQGLFRPQFFQFLLRLAMEKWCQILPKRANQTEEEKKTRQKYPLPISQAFQKMIKTLRKYEQKADSEKWRRQNLNSYQLNVVIKSYSSILQKIYEKYAGITQKNLNTKLKKKMLLDQFKTLCLNAQLRKTKQALKDLQVHYRTSKKLQIQDGISDTGLQFSQFLQTFCRFSQGLYLKPIGSQQHSLWQKDIIQSQDIPLFLKTQKLIKQIYKINYDLKNKKHDLLLQNGLFPEEVAVLMDYYKDKYEGGKDMMKKTMFMKNLRLNSLQGETNNKITLKVLIDLLKIKAAQIQQLNRQKLIEIKEQDQVKSEEDEEKY